MTFQRQWPARGFTIRCEGDAPRAIIAKGRVRWALEALTAAGSTGFTPLANPAPRWAAYVYSLRALGVAIDTITEKHGGSFAGHHARYVLCCNVTPGRNGIDPFCGTGDVEGGAA